MIVFEARSFFNRGHHVFLANGPFRKLVVGACLRARAAVVCSCCDAVMFALAPVQVHVEGGDQNTEGIFYDNPDFWTDILDD